MKNKTKSLCRRVLIHDFQAREYLRFLLQDAREQVRTALAWRANNYGGKGAEGYQDYLRWAKESAGTARSLAQKLGEHFGKRSLADIQEDKRRWEQRMAAREDARPTADFGAALEARVAA